MEERRRIGAEAEEDAMADRGLAREAAEDVPAMPEHRVQEDDREKPQLE